ncbi:hypothetical protein DGG96_10245 [Legionella qingyii]|uniref:Uncharacterized protein n=1 Tax=Legionella qingyii TaxID=2184757 RepID=A0A317U4G7_9GAMM|nr:hypothetical protein [Legionella qingyii]PWY55666.1 hypothetical protein DGG96_10245 [Legionella qingyii]RUR21666.1 hypothetical protein ELY20_11970 [Legionella qingyii]RUR25066.1 hypothetical protein ELY16_10400 [Legionella qingyii]
MKGTLASVRAETPIVTQGPKQGLPDFGFKSPQQDFKDRLQAIKTDPKAQANRPQLTTAEECKKLFNNEYKLRKEKDSFKSYRNYNLLENTDLTDILTHAQEKPNRTRSICVQLGWLKEDGKLDQDAPNPVKGAFEQMNLKVQPKA